MGKTHYRQWRREMGDFLGQWDLKKPDGTYAEPVVVIAKLEKYFPRILKRVKQPDGTYVEEKPKRYAISFEGKRKKWLAGPVSQDAIAGLYGPYIEDWVGKPIKLWFDPNVDFGGKRVGGIRVRPMKPGADEKPTSDPLDRPVDDDAADRIDGARADAGFLEETPEAAQ